MKGIISNVGVMAVAVMIGAAFIGALTTITDHSLEPRTNNLMEQLQSLDGVVTIGEDVEDPYEAEKQFRGLVVWNMLAAQQCAYGSMVYQHDEFDPEPASSGENELGPEDLQMHLVDVDVDDLDTESGDELDSMLDGDDGGQFTYFGWGEKDDEEKEDPLKTLVKETSFTGDCMGADPIVTDPLSFISGMVSLDDLGLSEWEEHSAQGIYGATGFENEQTFVIEDIGLMAMHLNEKLVDSGITDENAPDFTRAERAAVFYPEGVLTTEETLEYWENSDNPHWVDPEEDEVETTSDTAYRVKGPMLLSFGERAWKYSIGEGRFELDVRDGRGTGLYDYNFGEGGWPESMNAFRVRMVNVPTITSDEFDVEEFLDKGDLIQEHRYLANNLEYLVCEGSEGFVQANAGADINHERKQYSDDDPIFRDVVYPRVEVESGADNCLEDVLSYIGIGTSLKDADGEELPEPSISRFDINDEGEFEVPEPEIIELGEADGEMQEIPIYTALEQHDTQELLGVEWIDTEFYRPELAVDPVDCLGLSLDHDEYDITEMYQGGASDEYVYNLERFGEDNTFEKRFDSTGRQDIIVTPVEPSDSLGALDDVTLRLIPLVDIDLEPYIASPSSVSDLGTDSEIIVGIKQEDQDEDDEDQEDLFRIEIDYRIDDNGNLIVDTSGAHDLSTYFAIERPTIGGTERLDKGPEDAFLQVEVDLTVTDPRDILDADTNAAAISENHFAMTDIRGTGGQVFFDVEEFELIVENYDEDELLVDLAGGDRSYERTLEVSEKRVESVMLEERSGSTEVTSFTVEGEPLGCS